MMTLTHLQSAFHSLRPMDFLFWIFCWKDTHTLFPLNNLDYQLPVSLKPQGRYNLVFFKFITPFNYNNFSPVQAYVAALLEVWKRTGPLVIPSNFTQQYFITEEELYTALDAFQSEGFITYEVESHDK